MAEAEQPATPAPEQQPAATRADPVRRWTLIVLALITLLLGWYLIADRHTPFTSQARVNAYVVPIAPQVSGRVLDVAVSNNQLVENDETLVQIDPSSYELAVRSAEASLLAARQELGAAEAAVTAADAALDAARARELKSRQDAERLQRIFKEDPGAVSERRVQSASASLEEARAGVMQAEAKLLQAREQLGALDDDNSRILAAQAALDSARLDLDRTRLAAPGRGLITDLAVDRGNYAQAGQALMTFIAIHDLWIQADFTENNLGNVAAGDEVEFVLDVQPGRIFSGRVRSVGFGVAFGSDSLGTLPTIENDPNWLRSAQRFPVLIDFEEQDLDERLGLRVGSQVTAIIYTGDSGLINLLGHLYLRIMSLLSYAY